MSKPLSIGNVSSLSRSNIDEQSKSSFDYSDLDQTAGILNINKPIESLEFKKSTFNTPTHNNNIKKDDDINNNNNNFFNKLSNFSITKRYSDDPKPKDNQINTTCNIAHSTILQTFGSSQQE